MTSALDSCQGKVLLRIPSRYSVTSFLNPLMFNAMWCLALAENYALLQVLESWATTAFLPVAVREGHIILST